MLKRHDQIYDRHVDGVMIIDCHLFACHDDWIKFLSKSNTNISCQYFLYTTTIGVFQCLMESASNYLQCDAHIDHVWCVHIIYNKNSVYAKKGQNASKLNA